MKKIKNLLIIVMLVLSLGATNVSAYTKESDEYINCKQNCDNRFVADGKVKPNMNQPYNACMNQCNAGLDSTTQKNKEHSEAKKEQLTKSPIEFCAKTSVIWQIVGYVFLILKIVVPIILIIFGVIDFSKAAISGKDDETKKAMTSLMWRAISAVAIFFIPTIVAIIMGLVANFADSGAKSDFQVCQKCIANPKKCDTSKDAGKQ